MLCAYLLWLRLLSCLPCKKGEQQWGGGSALEYWTKCPSDGQGPCVLPHGKNGKIKGPVTFLVAESLSFLDKAYSLIWYCKIHPELWWTSGDPSCTAHLLMIIKALFCIPCFGGVHLSLYICSIDWSHCHIPILPWIKCPPIDDC